MTNIARIWAARESDPAKAEEWIAARADGVRRYFDTDRRATYPAQPEEDTLALAEHYRVKWHQARILKALSFFLDITPDELSAVSGVHKALLTMEVRRVAERVGVRAQTVRRADQTVVFYRLSDPADRDAIRAVISNAWKFSGTFMPQMQAKKFA